MKDNKIRCEIMDEICAINRAILDFNYTSYESLITCPELHPMLKKLEL